MAPFSSPVLLHNSNYKEPVLLRTQNMFKGKRSYRFGPWHYCARCEDKTHISEMEWQRGLLLCLAKCFDRGNDGFPLTGQREAAISSYLSRQENELMPDPKLTDINAIESSMADDLIV
jgi:hypothetical protein